MKSVIQYIRVELTYWALALATKLVPKNTKQAIALAKALVVFLKEVENEKS